MMTSQTALNRQQTSGPDAGTQAAGSWKLEPGRAVTLRCTEAGILRITQGRVWATVDGPHVGPSNNQGDVVLNAGERLSVQAGQRVVIEPWDRSVNLATCFSWDIRQPALQLVAQSGSRWQVAVAYPVRDFGRALVLATQALGRLVWGLLGFGEFLIAGRGRVMHCHESNQP
jgi:hypothetical protein